jgi:hypothetical protein
MKIRLATLEILNCVGTLDLINKNINTRTHGFERALNSFPLIIWYAISYTCALWSTGLLLSQNNTGFCIKTHWSIGSIRHVGHLLAYCTCPGWLWGWRIWWNEWRGNPMYSEKTCPGATLSITNPYWPDPGLNPGRRGGKPATKSFSYGAA